MLLDLEKEVWRYASDHDLTYIPQVNPTQLKGRDSNVYAQQLAQVVVWIGHIQWNKFNGFRGPTDPVLDPMESVTEGDSILSFDAAGVPTDPTGRTPNSSSATRRSSAGKCSDRSWAIGTLMRCSGSGGNG
jgi:hypothetical protein